MGGELLVAAVAGVVRLTLSRPAQHNALTPALIERLLTELDGIDADSEARVVVLAGAGGAFCAGFDVGWLESPGRADAGRERDLVEALCARVGRLRVPTLAAVSGVAAGAGCDLAVSCDVRFASEEARFAMPPARLGLLYGHQGLARLAGLVGPAVAKELLFSAELIDARRALAVGLVNRVHPAERLEEETDRFARTVAANAPLPVAASKLVLDLVAGGSPLAAEAEAQIAAAQLRVWTSEDAVEGPRAFRERRPPRFRGL